MNEGTRKAFRLDDDYLLRWRAGGRSDKAKTLLFVAGVCVMILLGFKMLAAAPLPQYGGRRMRGPMTPERQLARMSKQLRLTDAQQAEIKPILEDQYKKLMALRQDPSLSRQDRMARLRKIHRQTLDRIRPLLTSDQQKELKRMRRSRPRRFGPGGPS